jgi:tetratricopeptide (TPR) repeat protein
MSRERLYKEANPIEPADSIETARQLIGKGAFDEARLLVEKILAQSGNHIAKANCHTLIAQSYIQQLNMTQARLHIDESAKLLAKSKVHPDTWVAAKIDMLMVLTTVLYFNALYIRELDACLDELKPLMDEHGTDEQQLQYYITILFSLLARYQWYKFPLEALTHTQVTLNIAKNLQAKPAIITILGIKAMIHMFRNEWKDSLDANMQCMDWIGQDENETLPRTCNYLAVTYRMTGNIHLCETWCRRSLDASTRQQNKTYEAMSKANLAWLYLKRKNYPFAEAYARESFDYLVMIRHPLLWLAVMPLAAVCLHNEKVMECGPFLHAMFLPLRKKLPENMDRHLKEAVIRWMQKDIEGMRESLEDAVYEATLNGYL